MYRIEAARSIRMDEVRCLFREYAAALNAEVCFQHFERELAALPGGYDPILLALPEERETARPAGCVALRPLGPEIAEMKRLFVRPEHRGHGLGRRLTESAMQAARERGYGFLRLDTLPHLVEAIALYRVLGFQEIDRYNDNPVPQTLFMEIRL